MDSPGGMFWALFALSLVFGVAVIGGQPPTASPSSHRGYKSLYELSEIARNESGGEWLNISVTCYAYLRTFLYLSYRLQSIRDLIRLHKCLANLFQEDPVRPVTLLEPKEQAARRELLADERLREIYSGTQMYTPDSALEKCARILLNTSTDVERLDCHRVDNWGSFARYGQCIKQVAKEEQEAVASDTYLAQLTRAIVNYGRNCFHKLLDRLERQATLLRDKDTPHRKLARWCPLLSHSTPREALACANDIPKQLAKIFQVVTGAKRLRHVDIIDTQSFLHDLKQDKPEALKLLRRNLESYVTAQSALHKDHSDHGNPALGHEILTELCRPVWYNHYLKDDIATTLGAMVGIANQTSVFHQKKSAIPWNLIYNGPLCVHAYMAAYACGYIVATVVTQQPTFSKYKYDETVSCRIHVQRAPHLENWPFMQFFGAPIVS